MGEHGKPELQNRRQDRTIPAGLIQTYSRYGVAVGPRAFRVALIKPSHYDGDGYVIQWRHLDCVVGVGSHK
jgi:hypothetical protein